MKVRIDYDPLIGLCFWVNCDTQERIDGNQVPLRSRTNLAISKLRANPHLIGVLVPFFKLNRLEHHKICVAALGYSELYPLNELGTYQYKYRRDGLLDVHQDGEYIGVIRSNGDQVK